MASILFDKKNKATKQLLDVMLAQKLNKHNISMHTYLCLKFPKNLVQFINQHLMLLDCDIQSGSDPTQT